MGGDPRSLQSMVQMLNGFRPGVWRGRYVIVPRGPDTWAVAELTTDGAAPFRFMDGECHRSVEEARAAVTRLAGSDTTEGGRR